MNEEQKKGTGHWTAKRKAALVMEIIREKKSVAEASRAFNLLPSEIEGWVAEGRRGMENALRNAPLMIRDRYERQLRELHEAYGEAMLELRARRRWQALLDEDWSGETAFPDSSSADTQ